ENADVYRAVWADYAAEYDADLTAGANDGILERAVDFAMEAHRGAVRKGSDRPYILHPIETLGILASMNADINLMAAGVLHDTLEDTDTSLLDIYEQFGADTAALVNAHTEDKRRCWFLRKLHTVNEIPNLDIRMKMLVIADKVANLRNMYSDYRKIGKELWTRFNAPKALQAWYYGSINDSLAELADYVETRDIYWEMTALFKDLFVDYFIDDENDVIYQASADKTIYMLCRSDCCWRQTEEGLPDGLRRIHRKAAEHIEDNWTEE
ncbi:MAG: bifunctional (p)ppGpp synthetase/guanosine-3',5'-bis(diphosphate) 3'-pyrophosphohydrolase, partial [Clostridia bacterium]|nr:bifunctional (p)ppGpp synthetase/guanosine-3',5'-bis(diphosphate) 3'-pyrophosphohydrolase [Clostridia bacterium]